MKEFWFYPQVTRIERKEEGQVADWPDTPGVGIFFSAIELAD
jgi:hypothetical protein